MTFRVLLAFTFSVITGGVFSQPYTSKDGRFYVDQASGCEPFTVNVTIDPTFTCGGCDIDLEGQGLFKQMNQTGTFTYNSSGTFWMRILTGTNPVDSILITVTPNTAPKFDVYRWCNNEISVELNDSNYDEYIIDYNDGSSEVISNGNGTADHTYTPGEHTVTVRGRNNGAADNCISSSRTVTPITTIPTPSITTLEVLDNASIRLEFDALEDVQYKLGIGTNGNTNFQQVGTIYNTPVDTVSGVRADDNYYCFQLAAFDRCSNTVISSSTICSANLDLDVRNKAIDVRWTTSASGIDGYNLTRTAADGIVLQTQPAAPPHTDTDITCGTEYCYQLTTLYPNGSRSISMQKCGTGFSTDTPTPIDNVTAVVGSNGGVTLNWNTNPDFVPIEFSIEKSADGNYTSLATTTQNTFLDADYKTEDASCYRIRYTDACDNESPPGIEACPIRLSGDVQDDNSIYLTWTPYQGWTGGVADYTIEKYSQDGTLLQTYQAGTATTYLDASDDLNNQAFVYVIHANAIETGLGQSVSNNIALLKDPNIFYPTAFTPNGDNLNDIFTVFGQYVAAFEMNIFNRWGELLFTTNDITSGWDGTYRGDEMPEGTYTFIAHITDHTGRTFKRSGSVLLLRRK